MATNIEFVKITELDSRQIYIWGETRNIIKCN